jgi:carbamoyl-phosphate synthase small subunit
MARKQLPPAPANHDRWLISYADFLTLLLALFVVLFASSQLDKKKALQVSYAVTEAFGKGGSPGPPVKQVSSVVPEPRAAIPELTASLNYLRQVLAEEIHDGNLQSSPWKTAPSSRAGVLVRPPNDPAKSSSIPPSPATRKSSPIPPIPARSSFSPTRKSAITAPAPPITKPRKPYIEGLVCASFPASPATGAPTTEAREFLSPIRHPRVSDLDTRALVRHLRTRGVMRGVLSAIEKDAAKLVEKARRSPPWPASIWPAASPPGTPTNGRSRRALLAFRTGAAARRTALHVVAYDFGIKQNILRRLVHSGCRVTVVPALTSAEDVLALKPDGVFLSNGPGDPEPLQTQVANVRKLIGKTPIFGICLGHQILGLALGGKHLQAEVRTSRRQSSGAQQVTQRVEITSHNHGFAVDPDSLNLKRHRDHPHQPERPDAGRLPPPQRSRCSACSITPKPRPARTIRTTCSTTFVKLMADER